MNLPKEWPEKGIKYMQEGHNKDRKGYTEGYNQCLKDCTAALPAVVEEAVKSDRNHISYWLEHKHTYFLYSEAGSSDRCDCGLTEYLTQPTDVTNK